VLLDEGDGDIAKLDFLRYFLPQSKPADGLEVAARLPLLDESNSSGF